MSDAPIKVIEDTCVGCMLCVKACPFGAIEMTAANVAEINLAACTLCGACVPVCPVTAIEMKEVAKDQARLDEYKDVWVLVEQSDGHIESVTYELLGKGAELAAELEMDLCAVLLGSGLEDKANELISRGASKVYVVDRPELEYFQDEAYSAVMIDLVKKHKPNVVLCGATTIGRSLIARVAVATKAGLTADCTGLAIDPDTKDLLQTRPAFGGNIMATIVCPNARPQMATVRHKVMQEAEPDESRSGEVVLEEIAAELLKARAKRVKFTPETDNIVNISEADFIVAGGRGLQKPENFAMLHDLAEVIGGGVGASRAAVDADWIAYSHQIGQTGKTVCPKIYIACGISGQIQHLAGMTSADIIVAINKDPDAPIFKMATFGIVGDVFEVVPMLTAEFKKLLGK